jgi:predicted  nucleic acid-binding Zn-ribbon protein
MAEFEFAGMTFRGGKMVVILTALSTLGGGAWGAFEFYNDYRNMKETIESYVAPDLSSIEQTLATIETRLDNTEKLVGVVAEDLDRLQSSVDKAESLARRVDDSTADTQRELRDNVYEIEIRVNKTMRQLDQDLRDTRKELEEKMQIILDNPLNNP